MARLWNGGEVMRDRWTRTRCRMPARERAENAWSWFIRILPYTYEIPSTRLEERAVCRNMETVGILRQPRSIVCSARVNPAFCLLSLSATINTFAGSDYIAMYAARRLTTVIYHRSTRVTQDPRAHGRISACEMNSRVEILRGLKSTAPVTPSWSCIASPICRPYTQMVRLVPIRWC